MNTINLSRVYFVRPLDVLSYRAVDRLKMGDPGLEGLWLGDGVVGVQSNQKVAWVPLAQVGSMEPAPPPEPPSVSSKKKK